jgi:hypothetical protein
MLPRRRSIQPTRPAAAANAGCSLRQQRADDGQRGVPAESRLQVVVLAAPRETRQRRTEKKGELVEGERDERYSAEGRDDLGHANTVAGRRWTFGASAAQDATAPQPGWGILVL